MKKPGVSSFLLIVKFRAHPCRGVFKERRLGITGIPPFFEIRPE